MARRKNTSNNSESSILQLIGNLIVNIVALLVVEAIIPGFDLLDLRSAAIAAIVVGTVNTFIRPVVQIIALPFTILTLGLAAFIINVLLLMMSAAIVPGFEINGFLTAAIASIVLAIVNGFLNKLAKSA